MHGSGDGNLHVYDVNNNFVHRTVNAHAGDFCALACGPLATVTAGCDQPEIKLWSANGAELLDSQPTRSGILSATWIDQQTVAVADSDGILQCWSIDRDKLHDQNEIQSTNLRCLQGLPIQLQQRYRHHHDRHWRDQQIAQATAHLDAPDHRAKLGSILDSLCQRGFSVEAALLLAEAAGRQNQPLWELQVRFNLVKALGESDVALGVLWTLATLLTKLGEPARARDTLAKILAHQPDNAEAIARLREIERDPLLKLSPKKDLRGDWPQSEQVLSEVAKCTCLGQKFLWRVGLNSGKSVSFPHVLTEQDISQAVRKAAEHLGLRAEPEKILLYTAKALRSISWFYLPAGLPESPLAFALETRPTERQTELIAYGIFDPQLAQLDANLSIERFNQEIKNRWLNYGQDREGKERLMAIDQALIKQIRQLGSAVLAQHDEDY